MAARVRFNNGKRVEIRRAKWIRLPAKLLRISENRQPANKFCWGERLHTDRQIVALLSVEQIFIYGREAPVDMKKTKSLVLTDSRLGEKIISTGDFRTHLEEGDIYVQLKGRNQIIYRSGRKNDGGGSHNAEGDV